MSADQHRIRHGTPAFRRTNAALFAAGVATFGLLYCVQPLMPEFSRQFQRTAAESSLALSSSTGVMAVALLFAGALSDAVGRKSVMAASLWSSTALALGTALAPTWGAFIALRAALGLTLSGLPAVAMAYLAEEVDAESIGLGMGLYIGGSALGGMGGRLVVSAAVDPLGWRGALAAVGLVGAVASLVFSRWLPPSRHFQPRPRALHGALARFGTTLRDPGLPWLYAVGFVLLGSFVTVYNYVTYRLLAPPYSLSQAAAGAVFALYVVGSVSSTWIGHLAGRLGRRRVLWRMFVVMSAGLALTLLSPLPAVIAGIAVFTFGFFGGHSIASSWVGRRAGEFTAQASAAYLFAYYLGSSVAGVAGGLYYATHGWRGVVAFVAALLGTGLACALRLARLAPLARNLPGQPAAAQNAAAQN